MISNKNETATDQWFRLAFYLCNGWNQSGFSQRHNIGNNVNIGIRGFLPENKKFQ